MSEDRKKIIGQLAEYLKFNRDYNSYSIYESELGTVEISDIETSGESDFKDEEKNPVQLPETPKIKSAQNIVIEPALNTDDWMKCESLDSFENEIKDCAKCKLLAGTRKQVVFGTGNPDADVVVVGEAPGADEDIQGKPFVGRAGKLLTDILKAINFTREEVYICNILKCRPPENRNPLPDEISNCEPYLFKQLEMIKPKLILAVGTFAAQTLLNTKEPLGRLRGRFHLYKGVKMMVTYHPAALLRNPNWKKPTWEDVQLFRKEYDKYVSESKS